MIFVLLLVATLTISAGAPVPNPAALSDPSAPPTTSVTAQELPSGSRLCLYRTTSQLIYSCLATIFACTWVAIHPNLPGPCESGFKRLRRKVTIMIIAMVMPELIAMWALRQRLAAARIMEEFNRDVLNIQVDPAPKLSFFSNPIKWLAYTTKQWWLNGVIRQWFTDQSEETKQGWTLIHGFFVQMGGFMQFHKGKPVQVLTFDRLRAAIERDEVDMDQLRNISEEDITDKSNGDGLGKLTVILQTTWFVVQCIGRWRSRLPLAELEVLTLAFAVLNVVIYIIWWSKPQGILVPLKLPFKSRLVQRSDPCSVAVCEPPSTEPTPTEPPSTESPSINAPTGGFSIPVTRQPSEGTRGSAAERSLSDTTFSPTPNKSQSQPSIHSHASTELASLSYDSQASDNTQENKVDKPVVEEQFDKGSFHFFCHHVKNPFDCSTHPFGRIAAILISPLFKVYLIFHYAFQLMEKATRNVPSERPSGLNSDTNFKVGRTRVPMFYSDDQRIHNSFGEWSSPGKIGTGFFAPLIFGGIHLTIWSALFHSSRERDLWRICALCITVAPLVIAGLYAIHNLADEWFERSRIPGGLKRFINVFLIGLRSVFVAYLLLYPVARWILFYISFSSLTHLSDGVYLKIRWGDLLPHF